MISKIRRTYQFILLLVDIILVIGSIVLSFILRLNLRSLLDDSINVVPLIVFVFILILYFMNTYNIDQTFRTIKYTSQYSIAFIVIAISCAVIFYLFPPLKYGRGILGILLITSYVLLLIWRFIYDAFIHKSIDKKRIAVLGIEKHYKEIVNLIEKINYFSFIGFIGRKKSKISEYQVLGDSNDVKKIIEKNDIDAIVLAKDYNDKDLERDVLDIKMKGIMIYNVPMLYEHVSEKIPVSYISDFWLIFNTFTGIDDNIYNNRIKRIVDLIVSCIALIITSPILILSAIAVKLNSKGPVFYKQIRVGYDDNNFQIIKFRSMRIDAEEKTGAVWASEKDPRITFVGKIIRKLRIDELPQLINILKGDMSLMGPRPERPEFVKELKKDIPYYSLRHVIKPGLTGWAQINYQYGASKEDALEKLQYDLYYIKHLSFGFDIAILLRTIHVILFGIGAR
ncbi:TIGR03013 family XrtA/PEP-CTERM system glycosyltransferase [Spirochaetota bacterium]